MNLLQLTPERAHEFVGYEIMFKTRGNHLVKRILDVSDTGKTVYIDHPDLNNNLEIITRKVYVLLDRPPIMM